ncbi:hypothetical protein [Leifsonia sp. fls2-241-R2A-40a]|uniref:hypothetical protein n=1 Tax=Leifsonia sp. fls2-241-R2A-40a TaxID=3040290 RepID=UPI00254BE732|nr:hypothetical protein [Leifsonia sp. fls2-241-R2A-40a]
MFNDNSNIIVIPPTDPNAFVVPDAIHTDDADIDAAYLQRPRRSPRSRAIITAVSVFGGLAVAAGLAYGALWMWVTGLPLLAAAFGQWVTHVSTSPWAWLVLYWIAVGVVYAICRFGRRMHKAPALLIAVLFPILVAFIAVVAIIRAVGQAFDR